jgi:AcrR family transcriptional regulator
LDAAVDELVASGYARFTTAEVGRRAQLSQGALFKHFPTKAVLVGAAAEHLLTLLLDDYRHVLSETQSAEDPVSRAVEVLWDMFKTPRASAALELCVAARTDPDLRVVLAPALAAFRGKMQQQARDLFPAIAGHPNFERYIQMLYDAIQGAALWQLVDPTIVGEEPLRYLLDLTRRLLSHPGGK